MRATVKDLKKTDDSPLENGRNIPDSPPVWEASLVIDEVLSGNERLVGSIMHTLTAASTPDGSERVVTPKLSAGDTGIWAIKRLSNGKLQEVYSPHEVERNVYLPLIKGRHDAYSRVLERLSGRVTETESSPDKSVEQHPVKPIPDPLNGAVIPVKENHAPIALPIQQQTAESTSSIPWNYIVVFIVVAFGLVWLLLKRRS